MSLIVPALSRSVPLGLPRVRCRCSGRFGVRHSGSLFLRLAWVPLVLCDLERRDISTRSTLVAVRLIRQQAYGCPGRRPSHPQFSNALPKSLRPHVEVAVEGALLTAVTRAVFLFQGRTLVAPPDG